MPSKQRIEAAQERVISRAVDMAAFNAMTIEQAQHLALLEYVVELEERLERVTKRVGAGPSPKSSSITPDG